MQHALRPEGIHSCARDGRCPARSFVKTEIIAIACWILERPNAVTRRSVQTFDGLFVVKPVEQDQLSTGDNRSAKARANRFLPESPGIAKRVWRDCGGRCPVSLWSEELWPVRPSRMSPSNRRSGAEIDISSRRCTRRSMVVSHWPIFPRDYNCRTILDYDPPGEWRRDAGTLLATAGCSVLGRIAQRARFLSRYVNHRDGLRGLRESLAQRAGSQRMLSAHNTDVLHRGASLIASGDLVVAQSRFTKRRPGTGQELGPRWNSVLLLRREKLHPAPDLEAALAWLDRIKTLSKKIDEAKQDKSANTNQRSVDERELADHRRELEQVRRLAASGPGIPDFSYLKQSDFVEQLERVLSRTVDSYLSPACGRDRQHSRNTAGCANSSKINQRSRTGFRTEYLLVRL